MQPSHQPVGNSQGLPLGDQAEHIVRLEPQVWIGAYGQDGQASTSPELFAAPGKTEHDVVTASLQLGTERDHWLRVPPVRA